MTILLIPGFSSINILVLPDSSLCYWSLTVLKTYSCLWAQPSLMVGLGRTYVIPAINPGVDNMQGELLPHYTVSSSLQNTFWELFPQKHISASDREHLVWGHLHSSWKDNCKVFAIWTGSRNIPQRQGRIRLTFNVLLGTLAKFFLTDWQTR